MAVGRELRVRSKHSRRDLEGDEPRLHPLPHVACALRERADEGERGGRHRVHLSRAAHPVQVHDEGAVLVGLRSGELEAAARAGAGRRDVREQVGLRLLGDPVRLGQRVEELAGAGLEAPGVGDAPPPLVGVPAARHASQATHAA